MSRTVRFQARARKQTVDIGQWWMRNRPAAPRLFFSELSEAVALISANPRIGLLKPHPEIPGLRRLILTRTRHHLYYVYEETSDEIVVLSVWSEARGAEPELKR